MNFEFKPGSLVEVRDRPWMVLPSEDPDILLLKPLGGSEEEITGIYKPLATEADKPKTYNFIKPSINDLGDFQSARLLYNATRLSFRNAAGPFRCLGKLSFRPRAYQMVPLIMALKLKTIRMLIADDVGVGKTIEALLIAKELYDRTEIKRFAVLCLPHLCEQWQEEIRSKFGIDAVIIRSGTVTALERQIYVHENIFRAFPVQVISIDYIKTGNKRQVFLDHCPELIIVDEAHTCSRPAGANNSQQLRFHLLHDISRNNNQNIILLTATPHSGKQVEFQSLLGMLKTEYEKLDVISSTDKERKELAKYFIQRRRADVTVKWHEEETKFPERIPHDCIYEVGKEYGEIFHDILSYAREIVAANIGDKRKQRYSYWEALALLRGVMSSPLAGIEMLAKKAQKKKIVSETGDYGADDPANGAEIVLDNDFSSEDNLPVSVVGNLPLKGDSETGKLIEYIQKLKNVSGIEKDAKARAAVTFVKKFLDKGLNPIVYCRYIHTAKYLGDIFREQLNEKKYKSIHLEVITSELNDELRKEKIDLMNKSQRRLLIATDCLSEGINLQEGFNAVLHYDLPWNPNRLEQREGRVDRFGQQSSTVEVALLYGSNNPIDGVVLDVLLRKAIEIRRSIGISVPFPENSTTVMEALANAILLKPQISIGQNAQQLSLFEAEEIQAEKNKVAGALEEAKKREMVSRSIFARNTIKPEEIEDDLKEVDEAIGDVKAVEQFVIQALRFLGVQVDELKGGYKIHTVNIPEKIRRLLTDRNDIQISFLSPTPQGFKYVGRNHPFTEQLSQFIINNALNCVPNSASRAAVTRTKDVTVKTVLFQFRVRNVIAEQRTNREIVAEEMWLWGYTGDLSERKFIGKNEALNLLMNARAAQNLDLPEQQYWLDQEMEWVRNDKIFREITDPVAYERSARLVESHTRFRKLVDGDKYKVVEPVLPMDVLGIYIFLPDYQ